MKEGLRNKMDALAIEQGNNHASPMLRSMYPITSRGDMARQFAQLYSLGFTECHSLMENKLKIALDALTFYATLKAQDRDTPMLRREFGCGCCVGVNDQNGDSDYNSDVSGMTAKEALLKIEAMTLQEESK